MGGRGRSRGGADAAHQTSFRPRRCVQSRRVRREDLSRMSCTHCGLCLEACPTYTLWGREPDSPRGRIVLIEEALAAEGGVTPEMAKHVDACIGCMACMTVCPEDVDYGGLLMSGRVAI